MSAWTLNGLIFFANIIGAHSTVLLDMRMTAVFHSSAHLGVNQSNWSSLSLCIVFSISAPSLKDKLSDL